MFPSRDFFLNLSTKDIPGLFGNNSLTPPSSTFPTKLNELISSPKQNATAQFEKPVDVIQPVNLFNGIILSQLVQAIHTSLVPALILNNLLPSTNLACVTPQSESPDVFDFTDFQRNELRKRFHEHPYITKRETVLMGQKLGLPKEQIKQWFGETRSETKVDQNWRLRMMEQVQMYENNIEAPHPTDSDILQTLLANSTSTYTFPTTIANPRNMKLVVPSNRNQLKKEKPARRVNRMRRLKTTGLFTEEQRALLRQRFRIYPYADKPVCEELAKEVGITPIQVKNWYQAERQRVKSRSMEWKESD